MKRIAWNKITLTIAALALIWSCGKDDGPTPPANEAPVIADQSFNTAETITDTDPIGQVDAEDPNGDDLTFSITTDNSDLFEITDAGALSLKPGKSLNFDVSDSYTITVTVTDGEEEATATITINVVDKNAAAPVFGQASYAFQQDESISAVAIIGTVDATDADATDELTFAISNDDSGLFEINNEGQISLMSGKELDYETATEHVITVSVTDGTETAEVEVTITVQNIPEADPDDPTAFVTTWGTENDGDNIKIWLQAPNAGYDFDFTVDWGDGTIENKSGSLESISHVYAIEDTYTVAINGVFPSIRMGANDSKSMKSIEQWGTIQWESFQYAFSGCQEMIYNATDAPDLSQVTDMQGMFANAHAFNGDLSDWDTSSVTDMSGMFSYAASFEGAGLESWDVGNVTDMSFMFRAASAFNADIKEWATGKVSNMNRMFIEASSFNQNLGGWNIGAIDPENNNGGMTKMLDNSGMSPENYTDTLIGWGNRADENIPDFITFGAEGLIYCGDGIPVAFAISNLTGTIENGGNNWYITHDGGINCN